MTNSELEKALDKLHNEKGNVGVVLFGIKYSSQLEGRLNDIVRAVFSKKRKTNGEEYGKKSFRSETRIGKDLAKYVDLKEGV